MMKDNDDINVLDIACYVINYSRVVCRKEISNFILNKLLYCIQKAYLKEYNKPLFEEDIVAWENGPFIPKAWFEYCYWGDMPIQSEDIVNINLFSDKIEPEKYKINISPRQNIINIKEKCIEFVENFDNPQTHNLLFTGNTGLGKTFMSNCIANELIKKGKNVLYQTATVLLETVIDNKMNKYKTSIQDNFYKDVLESDLLIIDDLGTECLNSMKLSELFTILNTRLLNLNNKVTKTIISTNLSINNIFKNYEERIGSRIAGFYDIYYFFGNDLRFNLKR